MLPMPGYHNVKAPKKEENTVEQEKDLAITYYPLSEQKIYSCFFGREKLMLIVKKVDLMEQ